MVQKAKFNPKGFSWDRVNVPSYSFLYTIGTRATTIFLLFAVIDLKLSWTSIHISIIYAEMLRLKLLLQPVNYHWLLYCT